MSIRLYRFVWYTAVLLASIGVFAVTANWGIYGWGLIAIGGGTLAAFAARATWHTTRNGVARPVGGSPTVLLGPLVLVVAVGLASGIFSLEIPVTVRLVIFATGLQAFLFAIDAGLYEMSRGDRFAVPLAGHLAVIAGSGLLLLFGSFHSSAALLAYGSGFAALSLHVFWMRERVEGVSQPQPTLVSGHWEGVLLTALIVGLVGTVVVSITTPPSVLVSAGELRQPAATLAGVAAVVTLATLADPPASPLTATLLSGTFVTVFQHAVTMVLLLNTIFLAIVLVFPPIMLWVVSGYFGLLIIGVLFEYLMVIYAHRRLGTESPAPSLPTDAPVTVVVTAANEATVLPESLEHNLEALPGVSFLLVPAANSTDGTKEVAREFQSLHPDRISVIEGTAGSKAGDLNQVWGQITTPYVLILDADETVETEFVARGLDVFRERPTVGIVQGRKAAAFPNANALARFVTAERQHNTWIEHPFLDDILDAGHFGGSSAMFRHEVPPAVGGWDADVLTEDIDLTLRLCIQTDWEITYVPEMVAREFNPSNILALVRQRERWARGWAQVAARSGSRIVRSRGKFSRQQTFGLVWVLFATVNAPLYVLFPTTILLYIFGIGLSIPVAVSIGLALFLLPARGVSVGYAVLRDPEIPPVKNPIRVLEIIVHAYLWIPFSWAIQLHSLYLQIAGAPKRWHVTKKVGKKTTQPSRNSRADDQAPASDPDGVLSGAK